MMRITSIHWSSVFATLLWAFCTPVHGQPIDAKYFRFQYDNDFFHATDRYYTQGIKLELAAPFMDRSPVRHLLAHLGEGTSRRQVVFAQQDCFTPSSIRRVAILRTDRPFAAALYIGQRSISTDTEKKRLLTTAITFGVIGPCALCAEEQVGIHRALDNIAPLGWQYQVQNDVILNYSMLFDQRFFRNRFAEMSGGLGAELGSYRTNASARMRLELGRYNSAYDVLPVFWRRIQLSAFISGEVRTIGYDASFQGGLFDHSSAHTLAASSLERITLRSEGGLKFRYHGLALLYSRTFLTREFAGGADHGWGSVVITAFF
jgi:lipid A 3-O-deacylase